MEFSFATGARPLRQTLALFMLAGSNASCSGVTKPAPPVAAVSSPAPLASAVPTASSTATAAPDRVVTFEGMCDASGAVELDEHRFVAADDEDNLLRIYDADRGGPPLDVIDLGESLALGGKKPEADFEACTRIGELAYFVSSHARTAKGKRDPNRLLFVAMSLPGDAAGAKVVGKPYSALLDDLLAHPGLVHFGLDKAAELPPKAPGGLNLEGLTALPDGSLLIGFRNPVPEGRALLVRLLNPAEVIAGKKAELSPPIRLDLQGLGVRALSTWRSRLLLIAGPTDDGGPFVLYELDESFQVVAKSSFDFSGYGPEGFFTSDARDSVLILSDDGARPVDGKACKKQKDGKKKRFRGIWIAPPTRAQPP